MSKIRSWKFLAFLALFTALFAGCEEPTDNYAENSNGSSSSINGGSSSGGGSQNWTPPTRIKINYQLIHTGVMLVDGIMQMDLMFMFTYQVPIIHQENVLAKQM